MFSFKKFLSEKIDHSATIEMYVSRNPNEEPHSFRVIHTIQEASIYADPNAPDTLNGALHMSLPKFRPTPAALANPEELTRQFHLHLYKNGYYSDAVTHPVVLTPEDQKFKSLWKRQVEQGRPKHERYHQDLGAYPRTRPLPGTYGPFQNKDVAPLTKKQLINPTTAVWSTRAPTRISSTKDDSGRIPYSSTAHNVQVWVDSGHEDSNLPRGYHRAATSDDAPNPTNRHFIRAAGIRRIPPGGLASLGFAKEVKTGLNGEGTRMGDDFDAFYRSKRPNGDAVGTQVKKELTPYVDETDKQKVRRERLDAWVRENYPKRHPDHPENPNYTGKPPKLRKQPEQKPKRKAPVQ